MKHAILLLTILVLAGCSFPAKDRPNDTEAQAPTEDSSNRDPPPEPTPTESPEVTSPTPPTSADPSPSAPTPVGETAEPSPREIKKSFELSLVDPGPASTPIQNCVTIRSPNVTRIHTGMARVRPDETAQIALAATELRFEATDGNASVQGSLPLELTLPPANATKDAEALVLLQVPEGQGAGGVILDITLNVTGDEPFFSVGSCRVAT